MRDDMRDDRVWGLFCLGVRHAKHAQPQPFEHSLTFGVSVGLIVNRAVYFNNQTCLCAVEIHDEAVKRVLAAKAHAELLAAQALPEQVFGRG